MGQHGKHRALVIRRRGSAGARVGGLWAVVCALLVCAAPAAADCRLALALGLDVSGSVDDREYVLQLNGIATALADSEVQDALLSNPDTPVALAIFEWSSASYQRLILDWTDVRTTADVDAIRATLLGWTRPPAPEATGLGAAMLFSADLFRRGPPCWDRTLDISGDGKNNDWPVPDRLRASGALDGFRINALVIGPDFSGGTDRTNAGAAELSAYFRARIIQGPGAFIEVALGYADYADAIRRKLLRELATLPMGALPPDPSAPRPAAFRRAADQ